MFIALNKNTEEMLYSLDFDKEYLHSLYKSGDLICPDCKTLLNVRSGTMQQHFYHISANCTNLYGEPETPEHQAGKLLIFNYLKKHYPDKQIHLEYRIEETNQRSDVILIHENGERWAFEFQCSKIKYDILIERHNLYKKAGVKDFWILNDDIHKYGISNKEEDLSKHRLCGLEKAIYDTFQAIYYLDTHVALFRVLKHYTMLWNTILEGKEHIFMFNKVKIKNGTWYTEEDELYEIERKKEIERQKENEENQKNNYTKILAYRIIDYYYPTGTRFKGTMSIVEICKNGKLTEFQLIKDIEALDLNIIYKQPYNIQPLLKKKLIDYYEYFVNNNSKRNIIIDSPMDWIRSDSFYIHNYLNLEHTLRFLKQDCIFRYKWWKKESKWFLPKDNRDMKWDP